MASIAGWFVGAGVGDADGEGGFALQPNASVVKSSPTTARFAIRMVAPLIALSGSL
jgi:hypothetical protein